MRQYLREFSIFWREFLWNTNPKSRIILWKGSEDEAYQEFSPKKIHFRAAFVTLCFVYTLAVIGVTIFLLSLGAIPGLNVNELRRGAILTSKQLQILSDSLSMQERYLGTLQRIMIGQDKLIQLDTATVQTSLPFPQQVYQRIPETAWKDTHPISWGLIKRSSLSPFIGKLESLQFPLLPPVQGLITQGVNHDEGHFAIDIATKIGSMVRSIGDGHIIFSDWTYEGGHTIAVQHADGYVSVYKHNQRLLKRVGDRIQDRESIAVTGDSGEYTSGPHLHFELWKNGLAQNPFNYLLGY